MPPYGQAAPLLTNRPPEKITDFLPTDAAVDFREAEIVKVRKMIRAQAETGGIEAVQPPDTPAKGAALHPEKRLFRQSLRRDFFRLLQNRFPDGAGVVGIPGAEQHGAAVHGLEAAAEGGIDDAFLIEPQIQLRGFAEQRLGGQVGHHFLPDGRVAMGQGFALER